MTITTSRTRVAWIAATPAPYRLALWRELAERVELRVLVATTHQPYSSFEDEGPGSPPVREVRTRRITPRSASWTASMPVGLAGELSRWRPSTVIVPGWELPMYWMALRWARRAGARVVGYYGTTSESSRFSSGPVAGLRRRILNSFDAIVTYGTTTTRTLERWGVTRPRIVTGFNASDLKELAVQVSAYRSSEEASERRFTFLAVGRVLERKNLEVSIQAMSAPSLARSRLRIVGDGPCVADLVDLTTHLGLSDRVSFEGPIPHTEIARAYASAQCLVLPSTEEVWGLTAAEALASGLAVVCSSTAGIAADIAEMPGVHIADPTAPAFETAMADVEASWVGYVGSPPILTRSADSLARTFAEAADAA
jgi:glycosyltransferase involved in cell wall biosynthesis